MARESVNAETLRGMLERGERVAVVDVRKREEHARGSVPGAVNFDAYDALNAGDGRAMEGLEVPERTRVVTVCNRGRSAAAAAGQLRGRGHEALYLEGGMEAWKGLQDDIGLLGSHRSPLLVEKRAGRKDASGLLRRRGGTTPGLVGRFGGRGLGRGADSTARVG